MMYAKLALENVKKSTKDYLIYIVTLTACISMFYAFLSISSNYYDPNIGAEFNLDILGDGIKYAILLITVLSKNARSIKKKICSFLDNCYLN